MSSLCGVVFFFVAVNPLPSDEVIAAPAVSLPLGGIDKAGTTPSALVASGTTTGTTASAVAKPSALPVCVGVAASNELPDFVLTMGLYGGRAKAAKLPLSRLANLLAKSSKLPLESCAW